MIIQKIFIDITNLLLIISFSASWILSAAFACSWLTSHKSGIALGGSNKKIFPVNVKGFSMFGFFGFILVIVGIGTITWQIESSWIPRQGQSLK